MPSIFERLALSCRRITLDGLEMPVRIGAHDSERLAPQPVVFSIDAWTRLESERGRSLADVYDYSAIRAAVREAAGQEHTDLQETLVDRIAALILADSRVEAVRVASKKPACGFGVEIFRVRGINA